MSGTVAVRPATEADLPALTRLDLTFPTGPVLALERSGPPGEPTFAFRWRSAEPGTAVYAEYTEEGLRQGLARTDLFLTAEVDGEPAGLLMILKPPWTDAGEITDLAVQRSCRRRYRRPPGLSPRSPRRCRP